MAVTTIPAKWISGRRSSPDAILRRGASDAVQRLIADLSPGDELRTFRNSARAHSHRAGVRGYVVLRDGVVVAALVTHRT